VGSSPHHGCSDEAKTGEAHSSIEARPQRLFSVRGHWNRVRLLPGKTVGWALRLRLWGYGSIVPSLPVKSIDTEKAITSPNQYKAGLNGFADPGFCVHVTPFIDVCAVV